MTDLDRVAHDIDLAITQANGRCGIYINATPDGRYIIRPSTLVPAGQAHTDWGFNFALTDRHPAA